MFCFRWSESSTPSEMCAVEMCTIVKCEQEGQQEADDEEVSNLEEAQRVIRSLRQRCRAQAHQLMSWRRAYIAREQSLERARRARCEQLALLSSRLLVFESGLARKQRDIGRLLNEHELVSRRQRRAIAQLLERATGPPEPALLAELRELDEHRQRLEGDG